jgi:hypothetical protein
MGRPFKNEVTKKHDRIIAKVYMQLFRWGFSSSVFEKLIAKAAYKTLGRANNKEIGNSENMCDDDILSVESIKKIYETWRSTAEKNKSYFARINYRKAFLESTAPKEEHLDRVISFFMEYMGQDPEKCIFETPPKCPDKMSRDGIWWRFFNGELDGDPVLAPKAKKRLATYPKIKK